jgi:hypothetical protein
MTQDARHPDQRRYCDRDDHGSGDDAAADRWCYEHHNVKLPVVTADQDDYPDAQYEEGPSCSICDGLGHGHPGA